MPNGLWEDLMVVMDPHHDQISVVCKVLGVVAMAVCVVALFAPGVNILAAGALVASLLSPLGPRRTCGRRSRGGATFGLPRDCQGRSIRDERARQVPRGPVRECPAGT